MSSCPHRRQLSHTQRGGLWPRPTTVFASGSSKLGRPRTYRGSLQMVATSTRKSPRPRGWSRVSASVRLERRRSRSISSPDLAASNSARRSSDRRSRSPRSARKSSWRTNLTSAPQRVAVSIKRGEVDIGGDVGLPGLVERVGAEMVRPVGAQGPILSSRDQVLGGVSVIDDHHRAGFQPCQGIAEPAGRRELHLDPATVFDRAGISIEPVDDRGAGVGVDHLQIGARGAHPALPPAAIHLLSQGHGEVVQQLVGQDHPANRRWEAGR